MASQRIGYRCTQFAEDTGCNDGPLYHLAKGRGDNPYGQGTCKLRGGVGAALSNYYILEHQTLKPVPRTKSRFRVSPSPRKMPKYKFKELMDSMNMSGLLPNGMPSIFN